MRARLLPLAVSAIGGGGVAAAWLPLLLAAALPSARVAMALPLLSFCRGLERREWKGRHAWRERQDESGTEDPQPATEGDLDR